MCVFKKRYDADGMTIEKNRISGGRMCEYPPHLGRSPFTHRDKEFRFGAAARGCRFQTCQQMPETGFPGAHGQCPSEQRLGSAGAVLVGLPGGFDK
ncbi:MAG TPA: hypothetical protein PKM25_02985 [Candidatus Ozemobacteraceae bacterium]|nr:hypothetical protein [Candidatus Ozemobacteraceae bacterium]